MAFYWDQTGPGGVPDVGYGRETTDTAIGAALASDESSLYQSLGFLDFGATGFKALGRRKSHGTAAADLAYGLPPSSVGPTKLPYGVLKGCFVLEIILSFFVAIQAFFRS